MEERKFVRTFLLIPALVVLYFVFRIFQPFWQPIAIAIILASLFHPAHRWLGQKLRGRYNLSALMMCLAVTALIVIPIIALAIALAAEMSQVYALF